MRVTHVIIPGLMAGAEQVVITGVAALRDAGVDARIAVGCEARAPTHGLTFLTVASARGIEASQQSIEQRLDLAYAAALARTLVGSDIVHVHGHKALLHTTLALEMNHARHATRTRPQLVLTDHGDTSHTPAQRMYERIGHTMRMRCDAVCVVNNRMSPMHPTSFVVPNPLRHVGDVRRSVRREDEPLRMVAIGRLSPEKGLDVLLRAVQQAKHRVELTLVGDGAERDRLGHLALELGIDVSFRGWVDDVGRELASADALAMPSLREGLPMALLEALAMGKPVVASRVGDIPTLVANCVNGLLVEPGDVRALALAVDQMSEQFSLFAREAEVGAAEIARDYSASAWALRTVDVYDELLRNKSRQHAA